MIKFNFHYNFGICIASNRRLCMYIQHASVHQVIPYYQYYRYFPPCSKLTFEEHIETVVNKASSRMAILKKLSFKKQISLQTKLLMFKAMIRPLWEYSCAAFIASPAAAIQKIQVIQNRCLRMCLNVTMYDKMKVEKLHEKLGIELIAELFKNLAASFGRRAKVHVPPVRELIQEHRKLKELKGTPLAMFITELDRDQGTNGQT